MAAIPVTITGVLVYSDLGVGGGPMPGGPGVPTQPPGPVDPGYGYPLHPVDPGYGVPIGGPPRPAHPIYYPPQPSHPIYNPGGPPGSSPPGYWGGGMGPGVKPQPHPEHPIVIPPPPGSGSGAPPIAVQLPVFPWTPQHPIVLPPEVVPPPVEGQPPVEWKVAWTPQTGWIVVGVPSGAHPAPSATAPKA